MSYPFPGMNPWLENPTLWRDVHQRLITALADRLAPQLEPRYFVAVETHTYISTAPSLPIQSRYPDVSVLKLSDTAQPYAAESPPTLPVVVEIPLPEPFEEPFLEVRLVPDGEVVTVIELLSHTNKRAGDERRSYLQKREALIDSDVHFVEIDLLRAHPPMPYTEHRLADYRIFIHRREMNRKAHLYPFTVQQPIPTFPLPLLPGDQEPLVDLGALLHELYDRARYRLVIDYGNPPAPALTDEDAAWAAASLAPG
ncbi:MAG TPA: DUF4058 family protein [Caldilinea sp.]|nr:DUF4058 family protein [Caldilinea sp.]